MTKSGLSFKVKLDLPKADELIHTLGLDPTGHLQRSHTQNIMERMRKYMPKQSGVLSTKSMTISTDIDSSEIVVDGPYAHYQYEGILYVDDITGSPYSPKYGTKHATDTPLKYDTVKSPQAVSHWDRALVAAEGDALVQDLQDEIDRLAKNKR